MRIVYLAAGAGNMYCGSCLQGNTLSAALRAAGQDCLLAPMYTPIRTDEEGVAIPRVAFGGINVYLQQRWAAFRHTPWLFDRLLDTPSLLRWATGRSSNVRPERLGALTVSMLEGEDGRQRKELEKLLQWLERDIRPQVVHLNNVLLVGVARQIIRRLGVPVVCSLGGEDSFLEKLPEPYHGRAIELLRQRTAEATLLVAMNRYYAGFMADYLRLPPERIRAIPPGLNLAGYGVGLAASPGSGVGAAVELPPQRTVTIGFLARVCPDKGLHQLAEALPVLAADDELPPLCLRAAGYLDPADRPYLAGIRRQLAAAGLAERFQYVGELDRTAKIAFLESLDVFCLPTVWPEAKGLPVLEAWAAGVPAVLPAQGAFPELIADTGGGLLYEPGNLASLAAALKRLILDAHLAGQCGTQARTAVRQRYNAELMARRMIELYEGL